MRLCQRREILDTIWRIGEVVWEHVPLSGSAMRQRPRIGEPLRRNYGQRSRDFALRRRWAEWEMIAPQIKHYPTAEDVCTAYIRTPIADDELPSLLILLAPVRHK